MNEKINQWLAFIDDEDEELIRIADLQEKWAWDEQFFKAMAKKEGREEGRKEGESEAKEKIAKNLLKLGVELEKIIEATGLTKEKIEKLK